MKNFLQYELVLYMYVRIANRPLEGRASGAGVIVIGVGGSSKIPEFYPACRRLLAGCWVLGVAASWLAVVAGATLSSSMPYTM
jgi:hypothetical protein